MWQQALVEVHERHPMVRSIFDEAHQAFTANDFRNSLRNLSDLRQIPMQLVVLSGTVLLQSQSTMMEMFGLLPNTIVICTPSIQPELKYILEQPMSNNHLIATQAKVVYDSHLLKFTAQDHALIFVPYLDQGKDLAELLNCEFMSPFIPI